VKLLIERGAPLEAANAKGESALGVSIRGFVEQSEWTPNDYMIQIADALIRAGAKLEAVKMTLAAAVCLGRTGRRRASADGAGRGGVSRSGKCHSHTD
jgi:hypothetical protein